MLEDERLKNLAELKDLMEKLTKSQELKDNYKLEINQLNI